MKNRIMSTTAIMPQNSMFEFSENLLKNDVNADSASTNSSTSNIGFNIKEGLSSAVRMTLSRMSSTPITTNHVTMCLMSLTNHQHRRLERAQSEPSPHGGGGLAIGTGLQGGGVSAAAAAAAAALSATSLNTSRYKTELCRPFEENGTCKYGDKCQFAHGITELRSLARHPKYKTELCRTYHTVGICPYGPRCHFVHNQEEVVLQKAGTTSPVGSGAASMMMAAAAAALNQQHHSTSSTRCSALSPSSIDSSSPTCSLSQSPTSSLSSFFSNEDINSPLILDDQRLPVFNRLATNGNSLFSSFSEIKLD